MDSPRFLKKFLYGLMIVAFLMKIVVPTTAYAEGDTPPADPTAPVTDPSVPVTDPATPPVEPIPADVPVVVLDEAGQPLPLATQAAADIIATTDPQWCPVGVNPGDGQCIGVGSTSLTSLLATIGAGIDTLGDGIIWIESGAITEPGAVTINSTNTHSLTFNGGWAGGTSTSMDANAPSTFVVPLNIFWGGTVTLNNISIDGTTYVTPVEALLNVSSNSASDTAVVLNNVEVTNALGSGPTVDTDGDFTFAESGYGAKVMAANGGVTVTGSTFDNNDNSGLYVNAEKAVTLTNILAGGNGGSYTLTAQEWNAIKAAHTEELINNQTMDGVLAYETIWWGNGAEIQTNIGNINVSGTALGDTLFGAHGLVGGNENYGLGAFSISGNIYVDQIIADGNKNTGADLVTQNGTITVSSSDFYNTGFHDTRTFMDAYDPFLDCFEWANDICIDIRHSWRDSFPQKSSIGGNGLYASANGNILLSDIYSGILRADSTVAGNYGSGAVLYSASGDLNISDGFFNNNGYHGADTSTAAGDITVTNSSFNGNGLVGYGPGLTADAGTYTSHYNGPSGDLERSFEYACPAGSTCNITLTNVIANGNDNGGAQLYTASGDVSVTNSTFNNNGSDGLNVQNYYDYYAEGPYPLETSLYDCTAASGCDITLSNVTASGNSTGAALESGSGLVSVSNSVFNSNLSDGLYVWTGLDSFFRWQDFSESDISGCHVGINCDIVLTNVTAGADAQTGNGGNGAALYLTGGHATVSDSIFNNNGSSGLYGESYGAYSDINQGNDIWTTIWNCPSGNCGYFTLNNVTANANDYYGAELYSDYMGSMTFNGGTFNGNSDGNIYAVAGYYDCAPGTSCDITLNNVTANSSLYGDGADLYTYYGGNINVNGGFFNQNGYDGLYVLTGYYDCINGHTCNINVNGTETSQNVRQGTNLGSEFGGNVTVNGLTTFENGGEGLTVEINEWNASLGGTVLLNAIDSNTNLGDGIGLYFYQGGGTAHVFNSFLNDNGGNGLYVVGDWPGVGSQPDVWLKNVTAQNNDLNGFLFDGPTTPLLVQGGPQFKGPSTPANILICSSIFTDNVGYGLNISNFGGITDLGEVVSTGNNLTGLDGFQDLLDPEGVMVDCNPVPVYEYRPGDGNLQQASCDADSKGMILMMTTSDWVRIPCTTASSAFGNWLGLGSLPHFPQAFTYISALTVTMTMIEEQGAVVGFKVPSNVDENRLAIVRFDAASQTWTLVPGGMADNGFFTAPIEQGGIYAFVLQ